MYLFLFSISAQDFIKVHHIHRAMFPRKQLYFVYCGIVILFTLSSLSSCLDITLTLDVSPGVRDCLHQFIAEDTLYEVEYQVFVQCL